jgi:flagellar motility protein MotE (MotC chaperone)
MNRLTVLLILLGLAAAPVLIGSAESTDTKSDAKNEITKAQNEEKSDNAVAKVKSECLASEELIKDLEDREQKLKEKETALTEREKEVAEQAKAVKEEVAKLETNRIELQGIHAKEMAEREEKVTKLIETFETMSPKTAAQVIAGLDDELAVTALSRLTSAKAGKILGNMNAEKSAKLSEMMAYGKAPLAANSTTGKEKARGESTERAPASTH